MTETDYNIIMGTLVQLALVNFCHPVHTDHEHFMKFMQRAIAFGEKHQPSR